MKQANFPSTPRTSYTYRFADGTTSTVHVGDIDENGNEITEEMISLLYKMDEDPSSYTYTFADGTTSTIRIGDTDENGAVVTADMIKLLRRLDGREKYNDRKNRKIPIGNWEKAEIDLWMKAHPYEPLPSRYHIPLDAMTNKGEGNDDCDKGNLAKASLVLSAPEKSPSPRVERLHSIVYGMTPKLQRTYDLLVNKGMSTVEVAELLGITDRAVRKQRAKIVMIIKKLF